MDPAFVLRACLAGVVATFAMLVAEVPMVRRFGFRGVFEWHEIQASLSRLRPHAQTSSRAILLVHFLAGGVAGVFFATAVFIFRYELSLAVQGLAFGVLLWVVTLGIHHAVTDVHPWKNDMGSGPVAASLVGHLAYGAALGFLTEWP